MRRLSLIFLLAAIGLESASLPKVISRPREPFFYVYRDAIWGSGSGTANEFVVFRQAKGFCLNFTNNTGTTLTTSVIQPVAKLYFDGVVSSSALSISYAPIYASLVTIPNGTQLLLYIRTDNAQAWSITFNGSYVGQSATASLYAVESQSNCVSDSVTFTRADWPTGAAYLESGTFPVYLDANPLWGFKPVITGVEVSCSSGTPVYNVQVDPSGTPVTLYSYSASTARDTITHEITSGRSYPLRVSVTSCSGGSSPTARVFISYRFVE